MIFSDQMFLLGQYLDEGTSKGHLSTGDVEGRAHLSSQSGPSRVLEDIMLLNILDLDQT